MTESSIISRVWNFANVLRDDGVGYGDYLEQITFLLFLKMTDELSKPPYNREVHIPEEFKWVSLSFYNDRYLQIGGEFSTYYPDIVYLDPDIKLSIDIEIDEPYVSHSGEPIHYGDKDKKRNDDFLNESWIVIRFAEEQVVKQPEDCSTLIQDLIKRIKSGTEEIELKNIESINRWDKVKAIELAKNKSRNELYGHDISDHLTFGLGVFDQNPQSKQDENDLPF